MRTSTPDHLYLSLGSPYLASLQLLYTLIGRYHIIRRSKHATLIDNHIYPPHQFKSPTHGCCEIALRASTDPYYQVELIQSTTLNHETLSHKRCSTIEKRCFRIRNGEWSVWSMQEEPAPGCHRVGAKLADLGLWEVPKPCTTYKGELQIVRLSTKGGEEMDEYPSVFGNFMMTFWLGARPCWQMKSQVGFRPKKAEMFHDECWPMKS